MDVYLSRCLSDFAAFRVFRGQIQVHFNANDRTYQNTVTGHVYYVNVS